MKRSLRRTKVMARLILSGVVFTSTGRFVASIAVKRKSGPGRNRNGGTKSPKDLSIPRRFVAGSAGGSSANGVPNHGGVLLEGIKAKNKNRKKFLFVLFLKNKFLVFLEAVVAGVVLLTASFLRESV